jgi:methionyl-tRNA formyltransferase
MRVVFAGTPEFASVALAQILAAGHSVPLVLTQPDRPAGRGMKLQPTAVKALALDCGIQVVQPRSLRLDGQCAQDAQAAQAALRSAQPDVMVVAAYGLLLPQWVLALPKHGCMNIHASLLPRWRGAAPIHRAIEAGDARTGITIMQMDAGLDTGDMLFAEEIDVAPLETTGTLHDKLAPLGARLVVQALARCAQWAAQPQPQSGVSYAHKVSKAQAQVDWHGDAAVIERRMRAFDPTPGLHSLLNGVNLKLWRSQCDAAAGPPGEVLAVSGRGVLVACGRGSVWLTELQRPGGKRLPVDQFLAGHWIGVGQSFETSPPL